MIIRNKKEKRSILTDVVIPADGNVTKKEAEKEIKYKSFAQREDECGT
jgi:hypothetical protein